MRLRTIGGLWIEGDPSLPPLGLRRMAILALIASAGRKGITRDRIIGILWPESEEEQARHTLSQHLYSLKRDTGRDWITATPELRLDGAISSDIGEILDALAAGDLERVADLCTAPFLDGFYLPGAPEFERWVEVERARLHTAAVRANEQLAARSDAAGVHADAVRHWRRLTEMDPLGGRYALGLMRALVSAGDRPGALAHARGHEELVRRELESDPDPSIRSLVASLRTAPPQAAPPPRAGRPEPAQRIAPALVAEVQPEPSATTAEAAAQTAGRRLSRSRQLRWSAAIVALFAIAALAFAARSRLNGNGEGIRFIAVGSIYVPAADSTVSGSMLSDLLATRLGSVAGLQVVANSRLVELMHARGSTVTSLNEAARRAGATEVIEGAVIVPGSGLSLSLRRVDLKSGVVRHGYVVRATDQFALVDSAAGAIARDLRLTLAGGSAAELRTASPVAYALYDEGLRAYYAGNSAVAYRLMTAALERDSTFAMAAYYAWRSRSSDVDDTATIIALSRAKRLAPRAVDRERLLIQSAIAAVEAPIGTAVAIAETLSVRYPTDPDGLLMLGQARGEEGHWQAAIDAFERVFAIDSAAAALGVVQCRVCTALTAITMEYLWWDSVPAAERTARRLIAIGPVAGTGYGALIEPLLRQGRRTEAEAAAQRAATLNPAGGTGRYWLNRDLIRSGRYEDLERQLFTELASASPGERNVGRWLLLFSLRNQGRLREADALAREGKLPGSPLRLEDVPVDATMMAIIALERGDAHEAGVRFREMAENFRVTNLPAGFKARNVAWRLTLAGTALAEAGDTADVRNLADQVEQIGKQSNFGRDSRLHHYLRGLILQRAGRHEEAVREFQQAVYSTTDGYTRINVSLAQSLTALGRLPEAIAVLQAALRGGVDGSNTYVTHTALHEALAEVFARAGRADSAATHYRFVERAWRHADPAFRERYERARAGAQHSN